MANLSSSGSRPYTLQDVIGIINDNANTANSPDTDDAEVANILVVATEDCKSSDIGVVTVHTASTIATYNNGTYGAGTYA